MTWDAYHRRKAVVREALALADRDRGMTLDSVLDRLDADRTVYPHRTDLLLDIQMAWFQRLSGQMDRLLSEGTDTPEITTIAAWVRAAHEMPGARALLDAHVDEPTLARALAKEHAHLASAAGIATYDPAFVLRGRDLQASARDAVGDRVA